MQTGETLRYAMAMAMTAAIALSSPAQGQTPPAVARGKALAERLCAGCHAINGQQGSPVQGADVPSFRAIAGRTYRTAESLQAAIMTPRHPMPAIPLELAEIRNLVAYIQSLE